MKSLVELLGLLLHECGSRCAAPVARDVTTLQRRVKHEGDEFITIALPAFCQSFEKSLDMGRIAPDAFPGWTRGRLAAPRFLGGLLCNVFDREGVLLSTPSVGCIQAIRQICLFGKKVDRPASPGRVKAAIEGFKKCDSELPAHATGQLQRYIKRVAAHVCASIRLDEVALSGIKPKHGPGATQERITGNQKWNFRSWHQRLQDSGMTYQRFGLSTPWAPWTFQMRDWPEFVEPEDEKPVRVTLVPKTLKAPRIIAIEPVCMQYMQQGLKALLVRGLESSFLTKGHVNFRDQHVNRGLAKEASRSGEYATIDMSDASDRVTVAHVCDLLETRPSLLERVMACRSTRAQTPDGDIIPLRKFASMGSALCFPMEALAFYSAIVAIRIRRAGRFPTMRNVHWFGRDVYVYGDDLIVPAGEAAAICEDLEAIGYRVNWRKSFWTGKFRESCGLDAYDNQEVTPVYLRRDVPASRKDVHGILSSMATASQLLEAGYVVSAAALRDAVAVHLGSLPQVPLGTPAIGVSDSSGSLPVHRWNSDLQRGESLLWVVRPLKRADPIQDWPAMAKGLRLAGIRASDGSVPTDPRHLGRSTIRRGITLIRAWVASSPLRKGRSTCRV